MSWLVQLTAPNFCAGASVNKEGIVVESAPILAKFICQPGRNLVRWARKNKMDVHIQELKVDHDVWR